MTRLLSVAVSDELVAATEAIAAELGKSKSEIVRDALRAHIRIERLRALQQIGRSQAERRGIGPEDVEQVIDDVRAESR